MRSTAIAITWLGGVAPAYADEGSAAIVYDYVQDDRDVQSVALDSADGDVWIAVDYLCFDGDGCDAGDEVDPRLSLNQEGVSYYLDLVTDDDYNRSSSSRYIRPSVATFPSSNYVWVLGKENAGVSNDPPYYHFFRVNRSTEAIQEADFETLDTGTADGRGHMMFDFGPGSGHTDYQYVIGTYLPTPTENDLRSKGKKAADAWTDADEWMVSEESSIEEDHPHQCFDDDGIRFAPYHRNSSGTHTIELQVDELSISGATQTWTEHADFSLDDATNASNEEFNYPTSAADLSTSNAELYVTAERVGGQEFLHTWKCTSNASVAFVFFGGVPAVIVPDNLKAAVIRAAFDSSGEVALNRSYEEIARYYGFHIDPTPAYAPKKKGKVERAGKYFRDNYIRPRLGQDIHCLRDGIHDWLMKIAGQRLHGTTGRRPLEVFDEEELPALNDCPRTPFSQVIWHQAKVHTDSHLHFRTHLYSVPWAHLHKTLWLRATESTVVIYAADERVATHKRHDQRGRSTLPGHLPPRREQWGHQSRIYWEEMAAKQGSEVFEYVLELFGDEDALLPLRKVQAIVTFLQDYPPERRDAACRRARFFGVTSVRGFKDILRKGLDAEPLPNALVRLFGELDAPRFARGPAAFTTPPAEA